MIFLRSLKRSNLVKLTKSSWLKNARIYSTQKEIQAEPESNLEGKTNKQNLTSFTYQTLKKEFKLFIQEMKDNVSLKNLTRFPRKGEIDILFDFGAEGIKEKLRTMADSEMNKGYSTAKLDITDKGTCIFSGVLCSKVPKDGVVHFSGFATLFTERPKLSFNRYTTYNWADYTHLVFKIRGDGRTYKIVLSAHFGNYLDVREQYHYPLFTRGGPYWQIAKVPLSHFYALRGGRIYDKQYSIQSNECSRVAISLSDNIDGPFSLEIEYIGLEYQEYHKQICPYEQYDLGRNRFKY